MSQPTLRNYVQQARQWRRDYPGNLPWHRLVAWYSGWRRSLVPGVDALGDALPWMSFAAIDFLRRNVRRDHHVFEWGTGGSTPFLARQVRKLVSIEHDSAWLERVRARMSELGLEHWVGHLIEPESCDQAPQDPSCWENYATNSAAERDCHFQQYARAIEAFPDAAFDFVIVDGRARPSCFAHALNKVKPGGYVLWDDTDRPYYAPAMRLAEGVFEPTLLPGPRPYYPHFTLATVWKRTSDQAVDLNPDRLRSAA